MTQAFEPIGFAAFDRLAALFRATRGVLDAAFRGAELPAGAADLIADAALPHVEAMASGLRITLEADDADLDELRDLLLAGGFGPLPDASAPEARAALIEALQARSGVGGVRELVPAPSEPLTAVGHARLVFAFLPRTPPAAVHFPAGRRTYADIPVPRSAGEYAMRIEELERELWSVAVGRGPRDPHGAYRRTYGFFDTAERLAVEGLRPTG